MSARRFARSMIEHVLDHYGYVLKARSASPRGFADFLQHARRQGVAPKTVLDVGVGPGTPWLYSAFPEAHHILIEPQREFEPFLQDICRHYDAEYHLVGAAVSKGIATIYQRADDLTGSSFRLDSEQEALRRHGKSVTEVPVPTLSLDTFAGRTPPFLMKIDTEGYEREVLLGASQVISKTALVLMEVAVQPRQQGEADLGELMTLMRERGFRLIDILELTQRSLGDCLAYMDVALARPEYCPGLTNLGIMSPV